MQQIFTLSERAGFFWNHHYRRLSWRTLYRVHLRVVRTLASASSMFLTPRLLHRLTGSFASFFLVFSAGTACSSLASHDHLQALRISRGCFDIDMMSLKIWIKSWLFTSQMVQCVSIMCTPWGALAGSALLLECDCSIGKKYILLGRTLQERTFHICFLMRVFMGPDIWIAFTGKTYLLGT